jgi:alkylated DNA repair dioxygenase AlkB
LLQKPAALPDGFAYLPEIMSSEEEAALVARFERLPFREFEFHGYLGRRRVISFGVHYEFADNKLHDREPIPPFLLPLRDRAAGFAGLDAAALAHALVTEYRPGAAIGWHRDRPVFGDVIGVSFASTCRFRFRRALTPSNREPGRGRTGWRRAEIHLAPRSAYLLRGAARDSWEHSIPPVEALRYSVTFRTLAPA